MSNQRNRQEFIHLFMKYAPMASGETEGDLQRKALRLMRYATTHVRIETELTNGYKPAMEIGMNRPQRRPSPSVIASTPRWKPLRLSCTVR